MESNGKGDQKLKNASTSSKHEQNDFLGMGDLQALIHAHVDYDKADEIVSKLRASITKNLVSVSGKLDDHNGLGDSAMKAFLQQGSIRDLEYDEDEDWSRLIIRQLNIWLAMTR